MSSACSYASSCFILVGSHLISLQRPGEGPRPICPFQSRWPLNKGTLALTSVPSNAVGYRKSGGNTIRCAASGATAVEEDYYIILGVPTTAGKEELKRAYRKLALQYHPDVNSDPAAEGRFIELSTAYEVLADEEQRAAYDKYGKAGKPASASPSGAASEAFDTWDEFKPHKRTSRKGSAREAAAAAVPGGSSSSSGEAQLGDVVEYPLSAAAQASHGDGRSKGVGFVVGRNQDRGDKHKLPPESLELVELEVLFCEEGSTEWRTDPLESAAFARLSDLRVIRSEFDRRHDAWSLHDDLSPGCGSAIYEEEIIV
eukprot:jgi/Mesen1/2756/ME000017S02127